jgi:SSS family solute:Na+ symporter
VASGLIFSRSGRGVLELINQVGSAFYGPVLAVFALGVTNARVRQAGVIAGVAAGLMLNLILGRVAPQISWLWWNPIGFSATIIVALATRRASIALPRPAFPFREAAILGSAFAFILIFLLALNTY